MGYIEVFQYYQTNNNLLNIVIWKYFFNQIQTQNTKNLRTYFALSAYTSMISPLMFLNLVAFLHAYGIMCVCNEQGQTWK